MDEELKTYLEGKFAQVDARFEQVGKRFEQVDARFEQVDARFEQVDARFEQVDARFDQVDARFDQVQKRFAEVDANFAQIREELHDTETRLLSEFWKWGRTTEIRVRRLETLDATTADRLAAMEERIFTLERKAEIARSNRRSEYYKSANLTRLSPG
jgi:chromosome segregation ATPase